ncbi:MAG: hypothetical protein IKI31_06475, partial [Treponema sp.]|nr:hypothetical protein [Treponema sp.]
MTQKKLFTIFIIINIALSLHAQSSSQAHSTPQEKTHVHSEQNFFPYRGSRMGVSPTVFFVLEIEAEHDDDKIELEIKFNTQIDPNSFTHKSILINGKSLPDRTRIKFNKAGTKIELVVPASTFYRMFSNPFSIELLDSKSFNELSLSNNFFEDIYIDAEYRFPPPFYKKKTPPAMH